MFLIYTNYQNFIKKNYVCLEFVAICISYLGNNSFKTISNVDLSFFLNSKIHCSICTMTSKIILEICFMSNTVNEATPQKTNNCLKVFKKKKKNTLTITKSIHERRWINLRNDGWAIGPENHCLKFESHGLDFDFKGRSMN